MRKKISIITSIALVAACAVTLTACASSAESASLYSTWFNRIDYTGIQPNINNQIEEALYNISFEDGSNDSYTVSFPETNEETGEPYKMRTRFYTVSYDWNNPAVTDDEYADDIFADEIPDIPDDYRLGETTETIYVFSMRYSVPVHFDDINSDIYDGDYDIEYSSICYFRATRESMQPIFSYEFTLTSTPSNYSVLIPDTFCYQNTVYYNKECTECTCTFKNVEDERAMSKDLYQTVVVDGYEPKTTVVDISESENEFFDNASIYMVMRALNYYSATTFTADVFIPIETNYSTYTISGAVSDTALSANNAQERTMLEALAGAGYFGDASAETDNDNDNNSGDLGDTYDADDTGAANDGGDEIGENDGTEDSSEYDEETAETTSLPNNILCSSATLTLSADLTGPSQTVWFCAETNSETMKNQNYTRCTMLKIAIPFAYTLGTLNFSLCEIVSHFDEYSSTAN